MVVLGYSLLIFFGVVMLGVIFFISLSVDYLNVFVALGMLGISVCLCAGVLASLLLCKYGVAEERRTHRLIQNGYMKYSAKTGELKWVDPKMRYIITGKGKYASSDKVSHVKD